MLNQGLKMVKLKNGEMIMGVISRFGSEYLLENPLAILIMPETDKKGNIVNTSVIFNDWIDFCIDTHFTIPSDAVLTIATPDKTMASDYALALKSRDMNRMHNEFNDLFESLDVVENRSNPTMGDDTQGNIGYNDPNELPLEDDEEEDDSE